MVFWQPWQRRLLLLSLVACVVACIVAGRLLAAIMDRGVVVSARQALARGGTGASGPPLARQVGQRAQTIESISGHTYIRKRISLTFFVIKLILWFKGLCQYLLY